MVERLSNMGFNKKKSISPAELGHGFEKRVKEVFQSNGYLVMNQNKWLKNYSFEKDGAKKREYDLVLFNPKTKQFYIVECKAHYSNNHVGLKQVMEFYNKLQNHNGRSAVRLMVTDTDYTMSARRYAKMNNIMLMNGEEFERMTSSSGVIRQVASRMLSASLEGIIKGIFKDYIKKY